MHLDTLRNIGIRARNSFNDAFRSWQARKPINIDWLTFNIRQSGLLFSCLFDLLVTEVNFERLIAVLTFYRSNKCWISHCMVRNGGVFSIIDGLRGRFIGINGRIEGWRSYGILIHRNTTIGEYCEETANNNYFPVLITFILFQSLPLPQKSCRNFLRVLGQHVMVSPKNPIT